MSAPLRIAAHPNTGSLADEEPNRYKDYLNRLVKLIPAEVVGLYLVGRVQIAERFPHADATAASGGELTAWASWTIFCFVAVLVTRTWGTSDKKLGVPPELGAIAIAAVAFVVWVYSFGDLFRLLKVWDPLPASLLVVAATFLLPYLYSPKND
jgi:hypothetical protein